MQLLNKKTIKMEHRASKEVNKAFGDARLTSKEARRKGRGRWRNGKEKEE